MESKPYIGITGPTSKDEVKSLVNAYHEAGYSMETPHIPMLGILASYKTLNGIPTSNRRYPLITSIPSLFSEAGPDVLRMIHYNSRELDTLAMQVRQLFTPIYDHGLCRAIQLNIVYPPIGQLEQIKSRFPEMEIVFQASRRTFEGLSAAEFAAKVKAYREMINYVLLDPSGGEGKEFNLPRSVALYSELKSQTPHLTMGFAGGLSGANVAEKVTALKEQTHDSNFCIDAEGALRDKITDEYGDDILNIQKCRSYLESASTVIK